MVHKNKLFFLSILSVVVFSFSCSPSKNSGSDSTPSHPVTAETFSITWETNIPSEKKTTTVNYGDLPSAGFTPATYEENGYTYTFDRWSPAVSLAFSDATYKALYRCDAKEYTIKFVDNEEAEISSKKYKYGAYPEVPDAPIKEGYTFIRWEPNVEKVTNDATYKAIYKASQVSISINCEGCSVNGKSNFKAVTNYGTKLTYHFALPSGSTYVDYPIDVNFTTNGVASDDYEYDSTTGDLKFTAKGNVAITAKADDYMIKMIYHYDSEKPTVTFDGVGDLYKVNWGDGSPADTSKTHTYSASNDNDEYTIKIYGNLTTITLTSECEKLSTGNDLITSVTLYRNIEQIPEYAFAKCSSLSTIVFPKTGLEQIKDYAFYYCSSLASATIPNDVISIGDCAFESTSITSVTIPSSVTSIGYAAFSECSSLNSMSVDVNNTEYDSRDNCNAIIETSTNALIATCKNTTIPDTVTSIGKYAFYGCSSLTTITISNKITSIGELAFSYCSSLTSVAIPSSVTSIGKYAFSYCTSLTAVDMTSYNSSNVPDLYEKAFLGTPSSLIVSVKDVSSKKSCQNKWDLESVSLKATQIISPSSVSLFSTKYFTLKETKTVDCYSEYTNTLVKNPNVNDFPNANCFDIMVGERHLTKDADYAYNPSTGEFTINAGIIDDEVVVYPRTLDDFTWEEISQISDSGKASEFFKVGESKDVLINSRIHKATIIDFDHDTLTNDKSKKAGITFQFMNQISDSDGFSIATFWNDVASKSGSNYSYPNSSIRKALNGKGSYSANTVGWYKKGGAKRYTTNTVIDMLPGDLRNEIKTVDKEICVYKNSAWTTKGHHDICEENLFLLSYREITAVGTETYQKEEGTTYEYWRQHDDKTSRLIKQVEGTVKYTGSTNITDNLYSEGHNYAAYNYASDNTGGGTIWLRSPATSSSSTAVRLDSAGGFTNGDLYQYARSIAPAFCI